MPTNAKVAMKGEIAKVLAKDQDDLMKKFVFQDWKTINQGRALPGSTASIARSQPDARPGKVNDAVPPIRWAWPRRWHCFSRRFLRFRCCCCFGSACRATNATTGISQYARFFADGLGMRVLLHTLRIGLETTLGCLLLAYPLGLVYRSPPGAGR